jgi:hypothetical protein
MTRMPRKIVFALALMSVLCLAVPAMALPPQCSCGYCTLHGSLNCTIVPGNTVVGCGTYYSTHCTGPGLVAAATLPSRAELLATLAAPAQPVCGNRS